MDIYYLYLIKLCKWLMLITRWRYFASFRLQDQLRQRSFCFATANSPTTILPMIQFLKVNPEQPVRNIAG